MTIKCHIYTTEQLDFIRKHIKKMTWKELTVRFNQTYGTVLGCKALASTGKRYSIKSGRTGRFSKGHIPFNKGKKGFSYEGCKATQFKKGNRPHTWLPVGTERLNADGYVDIKVQDNKKQRNWKGKHILIWEERNGPVPEGHVVIFGDRNKRNFNPDNLILVSRAQLARMNQSGLIKNDAELTKTGIIIADIYNKIGKRKRKRVEGGVPTACDTPKT